MISSLLHNWNDLPRETVRDGVERVGFRGEDVICVFNWLHPGMTTRPHSHPFEQLVMILQGRIRFHIGDESIEAGPGAMIRIPPDLVHYAEPVGDEVALNLDVFSPLRSDYRHLVAYQDDEFGRRPPRPPENPMSSDSEAAACPPSAPRRLAGRASRR